MANQENVADARHVRTLEEVHREFQEVEAKDLVVTKVMVGPLAYADMMRTGPMTTDAYAKGVRLWEAEAVLANDGSLVCWGEEPG